MLAAPHAGHVLKVARQFCKLEAVGSIPTTGSNSKDTDLTKRTASMQDRDGGIFVGSYANRKASGLSSRCVWVRSPLTLPTLGGDMPEETSFQDNYYVMDTSDMSAVIEILRRLHATNPDQQGFHLAVALDEGLYADAHITVRQM